MSYRINEIFYSVQGEGLLAGTPMVFIRFSNCNMRCVQESGDRSPGGFDCDTEFESGRRLDLDAIQTWIDDELRGRPAEWLLLTGGEPGLQLDMAFCNHFADQWKLAIETNGSVLLPHEGDPNFGEVLNRLVAEQRLDYVLDLFPLDWICVSPKVAEHAIRQRWAHEVKYVRGYGQAVPATVVAAKHQLISPAFSGLDADEAAVQWCIELVKGCPKWRLSPQMHKLWRAR